METQTEKLLKDILSFLESGNPAQAKKKLLSILQENLENKDLMTTVSYCMFWGDFIEGLDSSINPYEKGETIFSKWKMFLVYLEDKEEIYKPAFYALQRGIFSLTLQCYSSLLDEKEPIQKSEILRKTGLCYKKLGEFENAKICFSEANNIQPGQAEILADLADCYALCGEDRAAKVLFREAFYIDFNQIDLDFLDSLLIRKLIEKTEEKGYKKELLKAWIPVYGVLCGVFNMKRVMKPKEVTKLKQEIYTLENEQKDPARFSKVLLPRLINLYFWLIDYCQSINETKLINEVLLKIKILDTNVYNLYVK